MVFFLRRLLSALYSRKAWLPLVFVLPVLYLAWSSLKDNSFTVEQTFSYTGEVPIAATDNPIEQFPLSDLTSQPEELFLDRFALLQLNKRLAVAPLAGVSSDDFALSRLLVGTMALDADPSEGTLRISYNGRNQALGELLVGFFSDRLLERAQAGRQRLARQAAAASADQDPSEITAVATLTVDGSTTVSGTKALWSPERAVPTLVLLLLSLVVFVVVVAILEMLDPSFKSERQMARYLGLPILGAIPDTRPLVKHLSGDR